MIKVIARSSIRKGCLEESIEIYKLLVEETRKEKGCHSYELFEDVNNSHSLALIEEWESLEHLKRHTQTKHFIELVAKLSEYETEAPVLIYKRII